MRRKQWLVVIMSVTTLAIGIPQWSMARGSPEDVNHIEQVTIQETKSGTEIIVHGNQEPSFSVFKLSNPTRLFVDISNSEIDKTSAPLTVAVT